MGSNVFGDPYANSNSHLSINSSVVEVAKFLQTDIKTDTLHLVMKKETAIHCQTQGPFYQ